MRQSQTSDDYHPVATPNVHDTQEPPSDRVLKATWTLYASVVVAMLQPFHYGWSNSQVNLGTFNNVETCNARPVAEGTCLMFPGHTKTAWTLLVNAWIVGGMCGSFLSGIPSNYLGRKKAMMANVLVIIIGSMLQVAAPDIKTFTAGRFIKGMADGIAVALCTTYLNEISTPHNRHALGTNTFLAITIGILSVATTFWYWNTKSGFRWIAAFPSFLGVLFLVLSSFFMAESPVWLVSKGKKEQAEKELARLYGEENVATAMGWIQALEQRQSKLPSVVGEENIQPQHESVWDVLSKYKKPLIIAVGVTCANQLSGINAVFLYSSSIFADAGIDDVRYGIMIVDTMNMVPVPIAGIIAHWMKKRTMLLCGIFGMIVSAFGLTLALVYNIGWLSIVFISTYVACFGLSLGPLLFPIIGEFFPDSARGSAVAICVFMKWASNLVVGVGFPYVEEAIDDYGFTPFLGTLIVSFVFVYFMVPETSDMTVEEIANEFRTKKNQDSAAGSKI